MAKFSIKFDYEVVGAPPATCCTPNANPTMFVTLSWTDAELTREYLGCTWDNGETKEIYGEYNFAPYTLDYCVGGGVQEEGWGACGGATGYPGVGCQFGDHLSFWVGTDASMQSSVDRFVNVGFDDTPGFICQGYAQLNQYNSATNSLTCDAAPNVTTFAPTNFNGLETFTMCDPVGDCEVNCPGGWTANGAPNIRLTDGSHLTGSVQFTCGLDTIDISWTQGNGW